MEREGQKNFPVVKVLAILLAIYFLVGTCMYIFAPDSLITEPATDGSGDYKFTTVGVIFMPVATFWALVQADQELDD